MSQLDRYLEEGFAYFKQGNYRKAIASLTSVIKLEPDYAVAYCLRGEALKELEQYPKALKDLDKAIALDKTNSEYFLERGYTYSKLNEPRKAIKDYTESIRLNPKCLEAYVNRGNTLARLKKHELAIKDYTKAINLNPDVIAIYHNRGQAYAESQESHKAIADWQQGIKLLQDRDDIYANTISTVLLNLIEAESAKNPSTITEDRPIAIDSNSTIPCYLKTEEEIRAFIHGIKNFKTLWLDTEIADWQTRHPRLSLIQVLANPKDITGESTYILDVLDKPEIVSEFIEQIMANASIEKVFHNASYDLRYLGGKERAKNVTCTYKIAKKISKKVLGTSNLKLKTLAVELCNFPSAEIINEQGSDWGKRPLSEEQIKYAKMDTVYLARVHHRLLKFKPDIPLPRSNSFSVTDVRVAFECPRLLYLNKHFGGKTLFTPTSSSLGIGNTFHKLADEFIATVKKQPQFKALFEPPADRLEPKAIATQMQDIFYSLVFFPNYLQPTIQTKPDLAPALDRVWQGLRNLIQKWTELLIKNRAYCDADEIFKRTFVSTETKLQHDFNLPDGTLQPIAGKLDCLIYDYSKQHFCVVELKTYTPVDPSAQLAQVALYSYMIQQTKKVPVDSAVYCVLPEFKEYFYPCSELETNLHQVIPFKLQQMQQWLQWQPSQADAPPPTSNSALCNICPQQEKCQHYFPDDVSNDEPPKNSPTPLPESESAIANKKPPKNSPPPLPESEPAISHESIGRELVETLQSFNVDVEYLGAIAGATFIRIKLKPGKGVRDYSALNGRSLL